MNRTLLIMIGSIVAMAAMVVILARNGPSQQSSGLGDASSDITVMLFCAASNRAVMEEIRADYAREYGIEVEIQYGPSQTLLSSIGRQRSGRLVSAGG